MMDSQVTSMTVSIVQVHECTNIDVRSTIAASDRFFGEMAVRMNDKMSNCYDYRCLTRLLSPFIHIESLLGSIYASYPQKFLPFPFVLLSSMNLQYLSS